MAACLFHKLLLKKKAYTLVWCLCICLCYACAQSLKPSQGVFWFPLNGNWLEGDPSPEAALRATDSRDILKDTVCLYKCFTKNQSQTYFWMRPSNGWVQQTPFFFLPLWWVRSDSRALRRLSHFSGIRLQALLFHTCGLVLFQTAPVASMFCVQTFMQTSIHRQFKPLVWLLRHF